MQETREGSVGRKRLLFLCQTLPYPPDGGVNIRSYHLIRLLAQEFDVTAVCFYREAARTRDVEESLAGLREYAKAEAYPIPQEHSRMRWVWDHVRSVATGRAYTVYAYQSSAVEKRLSALLESERFSVAHVDSLDLSHYLPMLRDIPVVCGHHNVESALLARRAEVQDDPLRRWYIGFQARLTAEEERRVGASTALNITCSHEDAAVLRALAPQACVHCVPNGVDTRAFSPQAEGQGKGIVFVGGYTWFPNRDGMRWFADEILPLVRADKPDVPVTWVGRMPPDVGTAFREDHGVHVTGYVDDIQPHVKDAACFVVPLRVGGGTRLKILDAWAMGMPVVSTSIGCEGLATEDGKNILIRDEPHGFADAIKAVLEDSSLQHRLGQSARETAERIYDWDIIGRDLRDRYGRLLRATTNPDSSRRS